MATNDSARRTYIYTGLAGENTPGRVVNDGLYRMADGNGQWEKLTNGLPESPAVRDIAVHPHEPDIVYAATQDGPYRSTDRGDSWEKVNVPDHRRTAWSVLFHPWDPDVMFAGYDSCEIYRSVDGGDSWRQLPVSVRFPEVTTGPGSNPAKRVLMMAASVANPSEVYGAVEVGGIIRSTDGGESWENLSHGQYLNDDYVDMHGVLCSTLNPSVVITIARAGIFRSEDKGNHWSHVPVEPLNLKGQTYCRCITETPGDPRTIWVAGGANFQSDMGALFRSTDAGASFERVDMGFVPNSTIFGLAFDQREPSHMFCATSAGDVYASKDSGDTWSLHPLPEGASQVYSLACG